jgi:hypothetical protein
MRQAMSEALHGLGPGAAHVRRGRGQALRQLTASGRSFSDTELKQALGNMRRLEKDFLDTAGQVADPPASPCARAARGPAQRGRAGTATGKQVALTMGEFAAEVRRRVVRGGLDRAGDGRPTSVSGSR